MSKHMRLVWCLALSVSGALHAAEASKGMSWSGNVGTGYHHSWKAGTANASGFLLDQMKLRMDGTISNTTKVVLQKGIFLHANNAGGSPEVFDSVNYTSPAQFRIGTNAVLAFEAAYIDHKCAEGMHTWVGMFGTPFGIESMFDRYDRGAYYYSGFMTGMYYGLGAAYDLGVKIALTDILPGTLEVAVMDGRNYTGAVNNLSPALALRWSMESKSGDMSISPVVSAYLARFSGFAKMMMLGGGIIGKFGALSANAEVLWGSDQPNPGDDATTNGKNSGLAVYVEPSFDLGMATISAKAEFVSSTQEGNAAAGSATSNSDFNLGAAISKQYEGNFNVKLAYQHIGLSGKLGNGAAVAAGTTHANDFRVLFSTKW